MFKNKKQIYFLLFLGLALIVYFENKELNSTLKSIESFNTLNLSNPHVESQKTTDDKASSQPADLSQNSNLNTKDEPHSEFKSWITESAKNLEKPAGNPQSLESDLRAKASVLKSDEIQILYSFASSTGHTANERIFSTYMLSLAPESNAALNLLAQQKLSLSAEQPAHSIGEATVMQEKTIRTMAIDELFNRAKADLSLKNSFLQMAQQIQEPSLRNYALKRFKELP